MFDYAAWRSDFADEYVLARDDCDSAEMWWTLADNSKDDNPEFAAKAIITAVKYVIRSERHLVGTVGATGMMQKIRNLTLGIESDFEDLCIGGEYELTLADMLGAYIAAPEIDRRSHRYLLDAFRASMYNKPFDLSYHTEWVRRFATWD